MKSVAAEMSVWVGGDARQQGRRSLAGQWRDKIRVNGHEH